MISVIAIIIILLSFFISMCAGYILSNTSYEEISVYSLLSYSTEDSITTANDLLGKEITPILKGYIEGEDYTVTSEEDSVAYNFPFEACELGADPNIILYVDNSTSIIIKVHYSFRLENGVAKSSPLRLYSIKKKFTNYYDVDTAYSYSENDKQIKVSKEKFNNLINSNKKATFYMTWENTETKAIYSFSNLYEEKKEYGTLTFTKK